MSSRITPATTADMGLPAGKRARPAMSKKAPTNHVREAQMTLAEKLRKDDPAMNVAVKPPNIKSVKSRTNRERSAKPSTPSKQATSTLCNKDVDPVFNLIAAHKRALSVVDALKGPEDLPEDVLAAELDAWRPFIEHTPVTLKGLAAYVHHIASYPENLSVEPEVEKDVFRAIADGFDRLVPAKAREGDQNCPVAALAAESEVLIKAYGTSNDAGRDDDITRNRVRREAALLSDRISVVTDFAGTLRAKSAVGALFQLCLISSQVDTMWANSGEEGDIPEVRLNSIEGMIYSIAEFIEESTGKRLGEATREYYMTRSLDPKLKLEKLLSRGDPGTPPA